MFLGTTTHEVVTITMLTSSYLFYHNFGSLTPRGRMLFVTERALADR